MIYIVETVSYIALPLILSILLHIFAIWFFYAYMLLDICIICSFWELTLARGYPIHGYSTDDADEDDVYEYAQ